MRILIISSYFPPLNSIASLRPYSWAKYWTLDGHDVTVATTEKIPNLPAPLNLPNPGFRVIAVPPSGGLNKLKENYHTKTSKIKELLKKWFDYMRVSRGIFHTCRMPDLTDLWIRPVLKTLEKEEPWDLVVSTHAPYAAHIVAYRLKKKGLAKKWIADYRDPWTDHQIYPGLFPFTLIEKNLERYLMSHADKITTVSEPMAKGLREKHGSDKVAVISNGLDSSDLDHLDPSFIFPKDGKYRVVYTGSLYYPKQNLNPFFEALKMMSPELLNRFEFVYAGPHDSIVNELAESYGVQKWVDIKSLVSRETALRMQRDSDALLFLPWNDHSVDGVLTGKIYEYLFARRPILAVGAEREEAAQRLILEAKAGVVLNDAQSIVNFLTAANKTAPLEVPRFITDQFDRKNIARQLLELADQL